jgi:DNA (cytosine-5)-methyltransferase 1
VVQPVRGQAGMLTVGSLFAGIGGFDLAAEAAGLQVKWQVEINDFCNQVLAQRWPQVRRFRDVRKVHAYPLGKAHSYGACDDCLPPVDIICGGFPCQDVSHAGARVGITGERSGLWREMARIIRELRPRYVVVENVTGLTDRGLDAVLGDLAALGFDADWSCLSACAVGAPHTRERVFLVAYPASERPRHLWWLECPEDGEAQRHLHWAQSEPPSQRVVNGVPDRLERLTALGNAIVPQAAQYVFNRISEWERNGR